MATTTPVTCLSGCVSEHNRHDEDCRVPFGSVNMPTVPTANAEYPVGVEVQRQLNEDGSLYGYGLAIYDLAGTDTMPWPPEKVREYLTIVTAAVEFAEQHDPRSPAA